MKIYLAVALFIATEIIIVLAWKIKSMNKEHEYYIKLIKEETEELRLNCKKLKIQVKELGKTIEHLQTPEHELQGEFEADEESYNRIVKEWIYGADEEEGGLNGE